MCKALVRMHAKSLARLDHLWAWVCMILAVIFPGAPTMFVGCCGKKECMNNFLVGLLMMLTAPFIIGWVWSIYWGYWIVKISYMNFAEAGAHLLAQVKN